MTLVLTLIADPAASPLAKQHIDLARDSLSDLGARIGEANWLAPEEAADIPFAGAPAGHARSRLAQGLATEALDFAVIRAAGRRKRLLVADMESTIIGEEMIDLLADAIGIGPEVAEVTRRTMAGELVFEDSLRARAKLFAKQPARLLDEIGARMTFTPGARTLVATMRKYGAYTALVSGGFTCFTALVREAAGFHEDRANRLLIEGDLLTGEVAEPVLGRDGKLAALKELAELHGCNLEQVVAVGDGANDLDMVQAAGLGVAFRGKPILRRHADACLDHADLAGLLYLQGYPKNAFAEPLD